MDNQDTEGVDPRPLPAVSRRSALRRLGVGGAAAGGALIVGRQTASAQFSFTTAATEAAARRAVSAVNQALATGDTSVLDTMFAPAYVNQTPRTSLLNGQTYSADLTGLKTAVTELRAVVPDAVILIDDVIASGDTAAVRATLRGTLDTAAVSLSEGADPRLSIGGGAFARFVDGRVVESWVYDEAAALFGAVAPAAPAQPTEEPVANDREATRNVSGFDRVSLQGIGTLVIEQGDTESLTIDAEARVLRRIETEVQGGTLYIRPDRGFRTREQIVYSLTRRQLDRHRTLGSRSGPDAAPRNRRPQPQSFRRWDFDHRGTRRRHARRRIIRQRLGDPGGNRRRQTVSFGQAGPYDAANLESRVATVSVDGAAQAVVNVSESLDATASGAASITYVGNPSVSESTSGVGSVTPAQ